MPTEVITPEVVTDVTPLPELQLIVQQQALPPETAANLFASWAPHFKAARDIIEESRKIVVTDAADTRKMKLSGVNRLALKKIRVAADDFREKLKAESLRTGNAIQGFWHIFLAMVAAEEQRLKAQEDFVEIQEAKRQAALTEARSLVLTGLNIEPSLYQLGQMDEAVFQQLVEGTKLARAAEAERLKKAEAERIAKDAAEQAERERIRLENERLKREADEKEAALKAEREKVALERALAEKELKRLADEKAAAEAQAKAEREAAEKESARQLAEQKRIADQAAAAERTRVEKERIAAEAVAKAEREKVEAAARKAAKLAAEKAETARLEKEKIEAELRAAREEQAARHAAEQEAARKAAAAPDKDRLLTFANAIRAVEIPVLSTPEAQAIASVIKTSRDKFVSWCEERAGGL